MNADVASLWHVLGVAFAGSAVATSVVAWLSARLIDHRLQRDLEKWRAELATDIEMRREIARLRVSRTLEFLRAFEALVTVIYEEPDVDAHVSDYSEYGPLQVAKSELDGVVPAALRANLDVAVDDFESGAWRRAIPLVRDAVEKLLHGNV